MREMKVLSSNQSPSESPPIKWLPHVVSLSLCLFFLHPLMEISVAEFSPNPKYHVKVGMLLPRWGPKLIPITGYTRSASAVMLAVERIGRENLLNEVNFTFVWKFGECNAIKALGLAVQLLLDDNVTVIVGPPCNAPAANVGILAAYYDTANFQWGPTTATELSDRQRFPTTATITADSFSLAVAICELMKQYKWHQFGLIYTARAAGTGNCGYLQQDLQRAMTDYPLLSITFIRALPPDAQNFTDVLSDLRRRGRIVVTCLNENIQKRYFMKEVVRLGMSHEEYVYILPDSETTGFGVSNIETSTDSPSPTDEKNFSIYRYALILDNRSDRLSRNFSAEVMSHMKDYPFYCTTQCPTNVPAAHYAGSLYDTMYLYGIALNRTLEEDPAKWRSGRAVINNAYGVFNGSHGRIHIDQHGTRSPVYSVDALDVHGEFRVYAKITVEGGDALFRPLYKNAAKSIWATRGGKVPLDVPVCGFDGDECPVDILKAYGGYIAAAAVIGGLTILALLVGSVYMYREKVKEAERENSKWQIAFSSLARADDHSFESSITDRSGNRSLLETGDVVHYRLGGEIVHAEKFELSIHMTKENFAELRMMRTLEHDNVNRFIGLVQDGPQYLVVWKDCSRGSLQEVIQCGKIQIDGFFAFCLMCDVADGLSFIHSSNLRYHGMLTSANCLIDERWQVKISHFGLRRLRQLKKYTDDDLLWTAPELLRAPEVGGTRSGDIYSFAIISSELICLTPPWNLGERKERSAEIIYMVGHGPDMGLPPLRPDISHVSHNDLNPALMRLIQDCWAEEPDKRPNASTVKSVIRKMNPSRKRNLMDHVFSMLEDYAGSLEGEVEARTKELIEEKKKSDLLLYRMLPKEVAEKLKLGQSVEPESFESATVFFSDVVSFTTLAARCTPMQVVTLLNDLYTIFDGIIDAHDVYKVETIGDAYLCVSGLPKRNGNEHAREIASMAMGFIHSLRTFRIANMPDERINIRAGIHTGPCVAGVVGLSMPRYCLFGDTVNTASRMESNGKPGQIHLSGAAHDFLTNVLGGFVTSSRGEIFIKGKGVMETFWLHGREGGPQIQKPE